MLIKIKTHTGRFHKLQQIMKRVIGNEILSIFFVDLFSTTMLYQKKKLHRSNRICRPH